MMLQSSKRSLRKQGRHCVKKTRRKEKKRKAEAIGGHSEITTSLAHEDEFSAVLEPQGPSKLNKDTILRFGPCSDGFAFVE